MNPELQKYIQDARKAGSKPEDMRQALVDAGWGAGQVDAAIRDFHHNPKQLKVAAVAIISLLAVGGVAGAAYLAVKVVKKNVPPAAQTPVANVSPTPLTSAVSPQPTPITQLFADETTNWKEYRNVDFGFTIRHPADWEIAVREEIDYSQITLSANTGNDYLTIAPVIDPNEEEAHFVSSGAKVSERFVAGQRVKVFTWSGNLRVSEQSPEPQPSISEIIIFSEPEPLGISLIHTNTLLDNPDLSLVNLRSVLQTLTFIPWTENVSWKSFENSELGFRVEYPEDWTFVPKHIGFGFSNQFLLAQKPLTLEQKRARYIAIELHVDEDETKETAESIIAGQRKTSSAAPNSTYIDGATTLGGHPAYQYTVRQPVGPDGKTIVAIANKRTYIVYIDAGSIDDPILEEILKRFAIIP